MAPQGWATAEQHDFLESKIPDFQQAQRTCSVQAFWPTIFAAFFERWPEPEERSLTPSKKGKGEKGNVSHPEPQSTEPPTLAEWTETHKKQITNWFNNFKGVTKRRAGEKTPMAVINLVGTETRVSSNQQIYSRMFYNTKIKPLVDEALKDLSEDDPQRIAIVGKCTNQAWRNETEEVKTLVRMEREAEKKLKSDLKKRSVKSATPEEYASALTTLPAAADAFLKDMQARTGWSFTLLAGGPEPSSQDGKIWTLALHVGTDRFGQKFSKAHGKFVEHTVEPFSLFLQNVYSPEECMRRSLKNVQDGVQDEDTELKDGDPASSGANQEKQSSTRLDPAPIGEHPAVGERPSTTNGKQLSTAVNESVAVNERVPMVSEQPPTVEHPPQTLQLTTPEFFSAWNAPSFDNNVDFVFNSDPAMNEQFAKNDYSMVAYLNNDDMLTPPRPNRLQSTFQNGTSITCPSPLPLQPYGLTSSTPVEVHSFNPLSSTPLGSHGSVQPFNPPSSTPLANHAEVQPFNQELPLSSTPLADLNQVSTLTLSTPLEVQPFNQVPCLPSSAPLKVQPVQPFNEVLSPQQPTQTSGVGGSPNDDPATSQQNLGEINEGGRDEDNRATSTRNGDNTDRPLRARKPTTSKQMPTVWRDSAYSYLLQDLDDATWKDCVEKWLHFEIDEDSAFEISSQRMGSRARPSIFTRWAGTRNYMAIPEIPDHVQFADEWVNWWNSVQPKWRQNPEGGLPLSFETPAKSKDLSTVKKGGPSGLVTLLIGLKWWAAIRATDARWKLAVEDFVECFVQFEAGKLKRKSAQEGGKGKRRKVDV